MAEDIKLSACWEATQPYLLFLHFTFYLIIVFELVFAFAFTFTFMFTFIFVVCFYVCFCLSSIDAKEERTSKEGNSSPKELHK